VLVLARSGGKIVLDEAASGCAGPPDRDRACDRGLRDAGFLSAALEGANHGNRLARPYLYGAGGFRSLASLEGRPLRGLGPSPSVARRAQKSPPDTSARAPDSATTASSPEVLGLGNRDVGREHCRPCRPRSRRLARKPSSARRRRSSRRCACQPSPAGQQWRVGEADSRARPASSRSSGKGRWSTNTARGHCGSAAVFEPRRVFGRNDSPQAQRVRVVSGHGAAGGRHRRHSHRVAQRSLTGPPCGRNDLGERRLVSRRSASVVRPAKLSSSARYTSPPWPASE
jgi:hypothetical protein